MQLDPIKPTLKPPGTKRLKLQYDGPLSNSAFKFNLRRYRKGRRAEREWDDIRVPADLMEVGRCSLTLLNPS